MLYELNIHDNEDYSHRLTLDFKRAPTYAALTALHREKGWDPYSVVISKVHKAHKVVSPEGTRYLATQFEYVKSLHWNYKRHTWECVS